MNQKGFTLTELLVVTAIIVILSAIILPSYRIGERQLNLQGSAYKLSQDLRRAEELSMSAKDFSCGAGWRMKGYGLTLAANNDYYWLKARCDEIASPGPPYDDRPVGNRIDLEKGVKILILTINPLGIFFYPPEPEVDLAGFNEAQITISLKTDISKTKTVTINKAGLINVE